MSNQKHTPEPWDISYSSKRAVTSITGRKLVARMNFDSLYSDYTNEEKEANAARIVACVNACAGMKDPQYDIAKLKSDHTRMLNVIRVMQEATANDPTWINTNRALSSILKDCTHA